MTCPLCNLKKITKWYYESPTYVICDCVSCRVPMYVWRDHKFPSGDQVTEMVDDAKERFPGYRLDFRRRMVPAHYHFHVRPR
jgi:hypothetical protein